MSYGAAAQRCTTSSARSFGRAAAGGAMRLGNRLVCEGARRARRWAPIGGREQADARNMWRMLFSDGK
eukprot:7159331-Alexandrium_andersonii.AAC.1